MMYEFYVLSLIFGIFMLVSFFQNRIIINRYKNLIDPKQEKIQNKISNAQEILEKNDRVLFYIRSFDQNVVLKVLVAFMAFMSLYLANSFFELNISKNNLVVSGIFFFLFFILAPSYIQTFIIESRIRKIEADIPMFVDLLAVCVQAGMSIEAAIKFLETRVSQINKSFAPFLRKLISRIEVSGLEAALTDLQNELPSREISMMCSTLKQSLRYGSKIYDSLMGLSAEIRESSLLQAEEAIGNLSAKMSVPLILFFMFPVIIVIAAPGVMRVLGEFL